DPSRESTQPELNEAPGATAAKDGIAFVTSHVAKLLQSETYGKTSLPLVTYLSSGGFYDHVPPPPAWAIGIDSRPSADDPAVPGAYGPRVPLLALGPFARPGHISHQPLELSSLTVFMEWNWLQSHTGQLKHRDRVVSNIGDLLDPDPDHIGTP